MKTKIMLISMLASLCIFVFSNATWADGRKNRHSANQKTEHQKVSKHCSSDHRPAHWQKAKHTHVKKIYYRHRVHHRFKHDNRGIQYRHHRQSPHYRYQYKHRPYYKKHHNDHQPAIKKRYQRHNRPVYSHHDSKMAILASASHHGWKIKIFSRD
ncbi:MAG: hypothetical protein GY850_27515 [bacterium]|nr:hypothetical protein [bacterium]